MNIAKVDSGLYRIEIGFESIQVSARELLTIMDYARLHSAVLGEEAEASQEQERSQETSVKPGWLGERYDEKGD
jgi:hypothetical protein